VRESGRGIGYCLIDVITVIVILVTVCGEKKEEGCGAGCPILFFLLLLFNKTGRKEKK